MSWQETHRYYQALHQAEADLNRSVDGQLAWRDEYGEIFGTPDRLLLALRSYWNTMVSAQIDDGYDVDARPTGATRDLAAAHPGLVKALSRARAWRMDESEVDEVGAA